VKRLSPSASIALSALAVASLTACGSKAVVGVLLPTTGAAASYGESMKHGIDLAVRQGQADGSLWPWPGSRAWPSRARTS
jgi:ABC-type branched-subunit amino acid transport system substrate-binding protein